VKKIEEEMGELIHDLATPITIVQGMLEMAKIHLDHPERREKLISCIEKATVASNIIVDILEKHRKI
jgi:signal transduction histidine kinase